MSKADLMRQYERVQKEMFDLIDSILSNQNQKEALEILRFNVENIPASSQTNDFWEKSIFRAKRDRQEIADLLRMKKVG